MSEPEKLERGLGLIEATSLNMTFMVGIGPFIVIPFIVHAMGGRSAFWRGWWERCWRRWTDACGRNWAQRCRRRVEVTFFFGRRTGRTGWVG